MNPEIISILIAMVGCFVGLAGWLSKRDGKIATDAEWKGMINTKLDLIVGIKDDVKCLETKITEVESGHGERIRAVEEVAKSAHKRLDTMEGKKE